MRILLKILISALLIAAVSELSKRSSLFGAIVASLPLTSLLAMAWLYSDTSDTGKVIDLSYGIFWMVLPSLAFFLILPALLKLALRFELAMVLSIGAMAMFYAAYAWALRRLGVAL